MNEGMISLGIQNAALISVRNRNFVVMPTQTIIDTLSKKYNTTLLRADDLDKITNDVLEIMHKHQNKMPKIPGTNDIKYWK